MLDSILALLGLLIFLAIAGAVLVLPIVALAQFGALRARLSELEHDVRRLRKQVASAASAAVDESIPVEVVAERVPPVERKKPREAPRRKDEGPDWARLEAWLGVRGLGWAAVILMLLTTAFFLKVVFDRGLIGELGRVMVGATIGAGLTVAGWWAYRRGNWIFCQMLTSAGIAILYLSTFATFGFYRLVPSDHAAPILIVLVAEAFALAVLYEAPAIAIMAVVGGLLNPVLLHSDQDRYVGFFTYLAILNVGVVGLSLVRRWWAVSTLALLGTHALFWLWFADRYHPAKLDACLLFHAALFLLYLGQTVLVHVVQGKRSNAEELVRALLVGFLVGTAGYVLLDDRFHVFHVWMGTFAIGLAIVYAAVATIVARWRSEDELLLFTLLALSMFFVAAAIPLQLDAAWIAVGWAVQGVMLWWLGLRVRRQFLYGLGAAFLVLAAGRLLLIDTFAKDAHPEAFVPIFNTYGLPGLVVAGSLIAASLLQRGFRPATDSLEFLIMRGVGLAGVFLLWIVLSIETYDFFERLHEPFLARMSLSALWAVFAVVQLAVGLRLQHRPLRWLGLGLFAITLVKVMLIDTERLDGLYRVGAFFALSLMMAAGAWAYQKLRHALELDEPEEEHATITH